MRPPLVYCDRGVTPQRYRAVRAMGSCFVSYVGKANFGAAERYIREMYTEVYSTHALGAEISAIGSLRHSRCRRRLHRPPT